MRPTHRSIRKNAVVDGSLGAVAGLAGTASGAAAAAAAILLFAPVLLVVGMSVPLLRAEWLKGAEQGRDRTYYEALKIIKMAEKTVSSLINKKPAEGYRFPGSTPFQYCPPATGPKWDEVCQQITAIRHLIETLRRAGA